MSKLLIPYFGLLFNETTTTLSASAGTTVNFSNATYMDRSAALPNNVTITRIGVLAQNNNAALAFKIALENSSTNYDFLYTQTVNHTGSGSYVDYILTTPFRVPASGTYRIGAYNNSTNTQTGNVARSTVAGDQGVANGVTMTAATNVVIPLRYTYVP